MEPRSGAVLLVPKQPDLWGVKNSNDALPCGACVVAPAYPSSGLQDRRPAWKLRSRYRSRRFEKTDTNTNTDTNTHSDADPDANSRNFGRCHWRTSDFVQLRRDDDLGERRRAAGQQ